MTTPKMALLVLGPLIFLLTGCETVQDYSLTCKLWNNAELVSWAEPAQEPHLAFFATSGTDVLVQYDETREQTEAVRRRAYFLAPNAKRIEQRKKPRFVNPKAVPAMTTVPLLLGNPGTTNLAPPPAVLAALWNNHTRKFWVLREGKLEGPLELPTYIDSNGNFIRVVLTPFAVAGDTVMVGIVAGAVGAYIWAAGEIQSGRIRESQGNFSQ